MSGVGNQSEKRDAIGGVQYISVVLSLKFSLVDNWPDVHI